MSSEKIVTKDYLEERLAKLETYIPLYPQLPLRAELNSSPKGFRTELTTPVQNENFRVFEIHRKMEFFEKEYRKYKHLYNRCKKIKCVDNISTGIMTVGLGAATTGVVTSAAGVSIPISLPITIVGASLSGTSGVINVISKYSHSKEKRYIMLIEKSYQAKKAINSAYHVAMENSKIDLEEYNKLIAIYDEYVMYKQKERKKGTRSKNPLQKPNEKVDLTHHERVLMNISFIKSYIKIPFIKIKTEKTGPFAAPPLTFKRKACSIKALRSSGHYLRHLLNTLFFK